MDIRDSYKHKGLRKRLVESLREKGINDEKVLEAIGRVPRHVFFDSAFMEQAYEDKAFPIGSGQTISQPYTVAYQSQLLEVKEGHKVLEIGTGSGYQALVLAEMGAEVHSIERIEELYYQAHKIITGLGYDIKLYCDDGSRGLPDEAPFDRVLLTAAAPSVPETLLKQLKINGHIVLPLGDRKTQKMVKVTRFPGDKYQTREYDYFRFVPLIGESGWKTD